MSELDNKVFISAPELDALRASGVDVAVLCVWSDETHAAAVGPVAQRHRIPGSIATELGTDFADAGGGTCGSRPLPSIDVLQAKVRTWGICQESVVVVYDHDRALQAARAWWVLRWAGLGRVLILDGGFQAWVLAGLALDSGAQAGRPKAAGDAVLSAGHLPQLNEGDAAALARSGVLLDTRIGVNYDGGATEPGQPARGHIPGAVSLPAADNVDVRGHFHPPDELRRRFATLGVERGVQVGVYCGAGVSAAHAIAALASIGIAAPMYVGSWSAWSADPARPVAQGPEPG